MLIGSSEQRNLVTKASTLFLDVTLETVFWINV